MKQPIQLVSKENIQKRVGELGAQISKDYQGQNLTIIGVLKGSVIFMTDLIRKINVPLRIDFLEVASYGNDTESSGVVQILKDLTHSVEGEHVLVVEDIVDTGLTMDYLIRNLQTRNPKSLKICTLLEKTINRKVDIKVDYRGFLIEDKFVIGYGLDHMQYLRNLEYIGYFEKEK